MTYTAKQLPAWVRFRRKPVPKPQFGPPTVRDYIRNEVLRLMVK